MNFRQAILIPILLTACGHQAKKETPDLALVQKMNKLEEEVTGLREQNAVLKQALKKPAVKSAPTAEPQKEIEYSGEHSMYSAALDAFWAKDLAKLERLSRMYLKAFPQSVHADNVMYMYGQLQLSKNDLVGSLKTLNSLIKDYPLSSKVVSAEYLKAQIYAKMNLSEQSEDILRRIAKSYPGSIEASRARLQLKEVAKK